MPVYNGEEFLAEAIESILHQTFDNLEFLIINDGSTDNTLSIISSFKDERIKLVMQEENQGIVRSLNNGIEWANGQYIARMDADDVASPDRFEKQLLFMANNPDIAVCGTQAYFIDREGRELGQLHEATEHDDIKVNLLFNNSFIHSSTFFRTNILKQYKYSNEYQYAEDYHLFVRIALNHRVANIPDFLCYYRNHNNSTTNQLNNKMLQAKYNVQEYLLKSILKDRYKTTFADALYAIGNYDYDTYRISDYRRMMEAIRSENQKSYFFNHSKLCGALHEKWYEINLYKARLSDAFIFPLSPLSSGIYFSKKQTKKIFQRAIRGK